MIKEGKQMGNKKTNESRETIRFLTNQNQKSTNRYAESHTIMSKLFQGYVEQGINQQQRMKKRQQ